MDITSIAKTETAEQLLTDPQSMDVLLQNLTELKKAAVATYLSQIAAADLEKAPGYQGQIQRSVSLLMIILSAEALKFTETADEPSNTSPTHTA